MAYAVTYLTRTVQATPRGMWGQSGPAAFQSVESWLGRPLPSEAPTPDSAVLPLPGGVRSGQRRRHAHVVRPLRSR
jgi:hypothetical protein